MEVREGLVRAWFGVAVHELLEECGFGFGGYQPKRDAWYQQVGTVMSSYV